MGETPERRTSNQWLIHVRNYMTKHPDIKYKDVLRNASQTYTKQEYVKKNDVTSKKLNRWMDFVSKWKNDNPTWKQYMSYKDVLKTCKEMYRRSPEFTVSHQM